MTTRLAPEIPKPIVADALKPLVSGERSGHAPAGSKLTPTAKRIVERAQTSTARDLRGVVREVKPAVSEQRIVQIAKDLNGRMRDVLDACGLEDQVLVRRYLKPALNAKETKFFPMPTEADPTNIETRDVIAWQSRLRALDMAFNLKGSYAPRGASIEADIGLSLADEVRAARARVTVKIADTTSLSPDSNGDGGGEG